MSCLTRDERHRLLQLMRQFSLRVGDFVLTSGRRSDVLIDAKRTALHPEGGRLIGRAMLEVIRARWPEAVAVGGRTLGADPLAVSISQTSLDDGGEALHAFIVRKEPKGHGSANLLELSGGLEPGSTVVVLEDTATSGGSSAKAVAAVRDAGFAVCGVLTLVDREEGAAQLMADLELPFERVFTMEEIRRDPS